MITPNCVAAHKNAESLILEMRILPDQLCFADRSAKKTEDAAASLKKRDRLLVLGASAGPSHNFVALTDCAAVSPAGCRRCEIPGSRRISQWRRYQLTERK
jgi:hypothetical protein